MRQTITDYCPVMCIYIYLKIKTSHKDYGQLTVTPSGCVSVPRWGGLFGCFGCSHLNVYTFGFSGFNVALLLCIQTLRCTSEEVQSPMQVRL